MLGIAGLHPPGRDAVPFRLLLPLSGFLGFYCHLLVVH